MRTYSLNKKVYFVPPKKEIGKIINPYPDTKQCPLEQKYRAPTKDTVAALTYKGAAPTYI